MNQGMHRGGEQWVFKIVMRSREQVLGRRLRLTGLWDTLLYSDRVRDAVNQQQIKKNEAPACPTNTFTKDLASPLPAVLSDPFDSSDPSATRFWRSSAGSIQRKFQNSHNFGSTIL